MDRIDIVLLSSGKRLGNRVFRTMKHAKGTVKLRTLGKSIEEGILSV